MNYSRPKSDQRRCKAQDLTARDKDKRRDKKRDKRREKRQEKGQEEGQEKR